MQRSSENVGELAAALAKAQTELVNPEKSRTATIPGEWRREALSFRYAPLSSGLDIVRKTLGRHAIAVLQSTAIDPTTRLVLLTTTLAHGSGQWVSSDWPVCPSDQPLPQYRMGAALTYARRYALFSLVGIAGEDDLDAPDLLQTGADGAATRIDSSSGAAIKVPRQAASASSSRTGCAKPIMLSPTDSAGAREELRQELSSLGSWPKAVGWARHGMKRKNALVAEDAAAIESAFASKLKELEQAESFPSDGTAESSLVSAKASSLAAGRIDKSALAIGEPKRLRDKVHLRFVASQPCSSAAVNQSTPITCVLLNLRHSGLRSAMNSPFPYAVGITDKFIRPAMKRLGGRSWVSTRWRLQRTFGGKAGACGGRRLAIPTDPIRDFRLTIRLEKIPVARRVRNLAR